MPYLYLVIATVLPAVLTLFFKYLIDKTKYSKISFWLNQTIIGLVFGAFAVLCTEFGVDVNGAIINVRDSAPVVAGLMFGGPAGIIAGLIGGVERWFSVYWGGGEFTRLACSLATIIAGLNAANLRKIMFKHKRPSFGFSLAIGLGTEVLHMLLVLFTNMSNMSYAFTFVQKCAFPMILCNTLAVGLASIAMGDKIIDKQKPKKIVRSFSNALLICVVILFVLTGSITYAVNTNVAKNEAQTLLNNNLSDVVDKIKSNGLSDELSYVRVGQSGGVFVCDKNGNVLKASRAGEPLNIKKYNENSINLKENTFYKTEINNEKIYCEYRNVDKYFVFAYMPSNEADLSRNVTLYMMLFMETLIYISMFCLVYQITRLKFIEKIENINNGLNEITKGNLDTKLEEKSSYEFLQLSNDINTTVDALKGHIADAEKRIERELELARQIQKSAVPFIFPPFPKRDDFDIFASMKTAKEVGGDFYDFYFTDDKHFAFLIADVSGKGIPAAMFMMASKTLIKGLAERGKTVDEVFSETNEKLCRNNDAGMFVTAWMGVVNLESGHLAFANAGHNPPLLCRKNSNFDYLKTRPNFILAGMEGTPYKKYDIYLNPGDSIYLYTDGVTEANDINGKLYGDNRLLKTIQSANESSPKEVCKTVENDVKIFANQAEQSDDITMLCFKLNHMKTQNSITVYPDIKSLNTVNDYICEKLNKINVSTSVLNKVQIIIDEIYSNIMNYSNAKKLEVKYSFDKEHLVLEFSDDGSQYDPTKKSDPDITLSADDREIGGLGIYMVKKTASSLDYKYENCKNILQISIDLK